MLAQVAGACIRRLAASARSVFNFIIHANSVPLCSVSNTNVSFARHHQTCEIHQLMETFQYPQNELVKRLLVVGQQLDQSKQEFGSEPWIEDTNVVHERSAESVHNTREWYGRCILIVFG